MSMVIFQSSDNFVNKKRPFYPLNDGKKFVRSFVIFKFCNFVLSRWDILAKISILLVNAINKIKLGQ